MWIKSNSNFWVCKPPSYNSQLKESILFLIFSCIKLTFFTALLCTLKKHKNRKFKHHLGLTYVWVNGNNPYSVTYKDMQIIVQENNNILKTKGFLMYLAIRKDIFKNIKKWYNTYWLTHYVTFLGYNKFKMNCVITNS